MVSSQKLNKLMVDSTILVLISSSAIFTENGEKLGPPCVTEYNENGHAKNLECPLFHMLKHMKSDSTCS